MEKLKTKATIIKIIILFFVILLIPLTLMALNQRLELRKKAATGGYVNLIPDPISGNFAPGATFDLKLKFISNDPNKTSALVSGVQAVVVSSDNLKMNQVICLPPFDQMTWVNLTPTTAKIMCAIKVGTTVPNILASPTNFANINLTAATSTGAASLNLSLSRVTEAVTNNDIFASASSGLYTIKVPSTPTPTPSPTPSCRALGQTCASTTECCGNNVYCGITIPRTCETCLPVGGTGCGSTACCPPLTCYYDPEGPLPPVCVVATPTPTPTPPKPTPIPTPTSTPTPTPTRTPTPTPTPACWSGNCTGCCSGNTCITAQSNTQCGTNGQACISCTASGKVCYNGACYVDNCSPYGGFCATMTTCFSVSGRSCFMGTYCGAVVGACCCVAGGGF